MDYYAFRHVLYRQEMHMAHHIAHAAMLRMSYADMRLTLYLLCLCMCMQAFVACRHVVCVLVCVCMCVCQLGSMWHACTCTVLGQILG